MNDIRKRQIERMVEKFCDDYCGSVDCYNCGVSAENVMNFLNAERTGHWMSFEQVADMLSGMFGECACNVNGNDEWLPLACKYADTECPNPKEENGCWMQFLLQGGADMRGESDETD